MELSILGVSFLDILKNEWLGIIASAFILISFLFSNQIITRMINAVGCVVFVVYGFLLPAYSTAFMNAALLVVHAVFLIKYIIKKRKEKKAPTEENKEENEEKQE
ncbi:MAG: hypothetical protein K2K12_01480 [Clostridia bacterium]|nr:hypothetical protein [Clostridia bacterium]